VKLIQPETFFVFDLDDTLYKEDDFHISGLRAVARHLHMTHGQDLEADLFAWKTRGEKDLWGLVCRRLKLPDKAKESLIWLYRLHQPDISLDDAVKQMLIRLERETAGIAVLTDGRSFTQRAKIVALGIDNVPCYISEEHGTEKPDPARFNLIEQLHPARRYVYVGDNPRKDFKAPNELGWITVGLRGCERNIHWQDETSLDLVFLPRVWVSKINDLSELTC